MAEMMSYSALLRQREAGWVVHVIGVGIALGATEAEVRSSAAELVVARTGSAGELTFRLVPPATSSEIFRAKLHPVLYSLHDLAFVLGTSEEGAQHCLRNPVKLYPRRYGRSPTYRRPQPQSQSQSRPQRRPANDQGYYL